MLEALRRGSQGIVVKILLAVLILSFAVWGIADVFTGFSRGSLAEVADTSPSPIGGARAIQSLAAAAEAGDPQGRILMKTGADWIARAMEALGWEPGHRLVLPGKLGKAYIPFLPKTIGAAVTEEAGTALDGALTLARQVDIAGAA